MDNPLVQNYKQAFIESTKKIIEENADFLDWLLKEQEIQNEILWRMWPQTAVSKEIFNQPEIRAFIFEWENPINIRQEDILTKWISKGRIISIINEKLSSPEAESLFSSNMMQKICENNECKKEIISLMSDEQSLLWRIINSFLDIQGEYKAEGINKEIDVFITGVFSNESWIYTLLSNLFKNSIISRKNKLLQETKINDIPEETMSIFDTNNFIDGMGKPENQDISYNILEKNKSPIINLLKSRSFVEYIFSSSKDNQWENWLSDTMIDTFKNNMNPHSILYKILSSEKARGITEGIIQDPILRSSIAEYIAKTNIKDTIHLSIEDILLTKEIKKWFPNLRIAHANDIAWLVADKTFFVDVLLNDTEIKTSIIESIRSLSNDSAYKKLIDNQEFQDTIYWAFTTENNRLWNIISNMLLNDKNAIASILEWDILDYFITGEWDKNKIYDILDTTATKLNIIGVLRENWDLLHIFFVALKQFIQSKKDINNKTYSDYLQKSSRDRLKYPPEYSELDLFFSILGSMNPNQRATLEALIKDFFVIWLDVMENFLNNFSLQEIIEGEQNGFFFTQLYDNIFNNTSFKKNMLDLTIWDQKFTKNFESIMKEDLTIYMIKDLIRNNIGSDSDMINIVLDDCLDDDEFIWMIFWSNGIMNPDIQKAIKDFLANINLSPNDDSAWSLYMKEYQAYSNSKYKREQSYNEPTYSWAPRVQMEEIIEKEENPSLNISTYKKKTVLYYRNWGVYAMEIAHNKNNSFSLFNGKEQSGNFLNIQDALFVSDIIVSLWNLNNRDKNIFSDCLRKDDPSPWFYMGTRPSPQNTPQRPIFPCSSDDSKKLQTLGLINKDWSMDGLKNLISASAKYFDDFLNTENKNKTEFKDDMSMPNMYDIIKLDAWTWNEVNIKFKNDIINAIDKDSLNPNTWRYTQGLRQKVVDIACENELFMENLIRTIIQQVPTNVRSIKVPKKTYKIQHGGFFNIDPTETTTTIISVDMIQSDVLRDLADDLLHDEDCMRNLKEQMTKYSIQEFIQSNFMNDNIAGIIINTLWLTFLDKAWKVIDYIIEHPAPMYHGIMWYYPPQH